MTEAQVRQLRDNIYGPQIESSWDSVRSYWMADVEWLIKNQPADTKEWQERHKE